jgi:hypothetical protein
MANSEPTGGQTLAGRLKAYGAVAVATAALIGAIDLVYSRIADSRLVNDAISGIEKVIAARPATTQPKFRIDISGDHVADNPDAPAIASAVRSAAAKKEDRFVILSRSDREFIQAMAGTAGWDLEFRAAQMEAPNSKQPLLFQCDKPVTTENVIKAFQQYRSDDRGWMEVCSWKRLLF